MISTRPHILSNRATRQRLWTKTWCGGFTLIELLVVIAIIAILAAILTPAVRTGINNAQINRARMEISTLLTASQSFYSEYGIWPCADNGSTQDFTYHATGGDTNNVRSQARVIKALRGVDETLNPRKITFLEVKSTSMQGTDKDNNTYTDAQSYFIDPWGNPYIIMLDTNFDGDLSPFLTLSNWRPTNRLERIRVAVYSLGPKGPEWNTLTGSDGNAEKEKSAILSWK